MTWLIQIMKLKIWKYKKKNINNDPLIIVNDNETIGWEEFFDKNKEQKL